MRIQSLSWMGLFVPLLALAGCASEFGDTDEGAAMQADELRGARSVRFSELVDPAGIGVAGESETRVVITRASQYRRLFGHAPPADVDFGAGDAVLFYSAGVQRTGGFAASVLSIQDDRGRLRVSTQLESPGSGCMVTQALTKPFALVKFKLPRGYQGARFTANDVVRECPPVNPCTWVKCTAGHHCELEEVVCVTAPCYPVPVCVPDEPSVFCGGIAAFPCPGLGTCVDDPNDGCDTEQGGADCGGLCVCDQSESCKAGYLFDSSPEVCGCVTDPTLDPCASVRCAAGTECQVIDGSAACVPTTSACAATLCPVDTTCQEIDGAAQCVSNGSLACGSSTCAEGTVCCNSSCGICTPPGFACIQIACE